MKIQCQTLFDITATGTTSKLSRLWTVLQFIAIMNLTGDKTARISNDGAVKITVDSVIAVYEYILSELSK
jgi:hypothetical protein